MSEERTEALKLSYNLVQKSNNNSLCMFGIYVNMREQ